MPIPPHPRRAEAEQLLRDGKLSTEVAALVGAAVRTVRAWRRRLKLPREQNGRGKGYAAQQLASEVVGRLLAGDLVSKIAHDYEVSEQRVRQIRAGLTDGTKIK